MATQQPVSNVRSQDLPSRGTPRPPRLSMNKPISILLWGIACVTTYQLVSVLNPMLRREYAIAVAIITQIVFTWLERPVLGGRPNKISFAAIVIDTLINAGGIYPMALRAGATPPAQMLIAALKLSPEISPMGGALLALVFGFLLAAAPEAVWRWKD